MRFLIASILAILTVRASAQQPLATQDCSTLRYVKHKSAWLCGEAVVCSGDICGRPSDLDFDDEFDVILRDRHGKKLESIRLSYEHRNFCFEGRSNGDYQLAFVLYEKGVPQPARVFPTKYTATKTSQTTRYTWLKQTVPGAVIKSCSRKM
jgi:hypothetical protein